MKEDQQSSRIGLILRHIKGGAVRQMDYVILEMICRSACAREKAPSSSQGALSSDGRLSGVRGPCHDHSPVRGGFNKGPFITFCQVTCLCSYLSLFFTPCSEAMKDIRRASYNPWLRCTSSLLRGNVKVISWCFVVFSVKSRRIQWWSYYTMWHICMDQRIHLRVREKYMCNLYIWMALLHLCRCTALLYGNRIRVRVIDKTLRNKTENFTYALR